MNTCLPSALKMAPSGLSKALSRCTTCAFSGYVGSDWESAYRGVSARDSSIERFKADRMRVLLSKGEQWRQQCVFRSGPLTSCQESAVAGTMKSVFAALEGCLPVAASQ